MYNPVSTYRIQLDKDMRFSDLEHVISYLHDLGIRTISGTADLTPVQSPRDLKDPCRLMPFPMEPAAPGLLAGHLASRKMGWIQEIVPGYVTFHPDHPWLFDVLEKGPFSLYASYFDIDWDHPAVPGRLLVPLSDKEPELMVESGEIRLLFSSDRFFIRAGGLNFPLNAGSWALILDRAAGGRQRISESLVVSAFEISGIRQPGVLSEAWRVFLDNFSRAMQDTSLAEQVKERTALINEDIAALHELLNIQYYQLCSVQQQKSVINFRRFFAGSTSICLDMENPEVFKEVHQKVSEAVEQDIFQGFSIGRLDCLLAPADYLARLRRQMGNELYLIAEKWPAGELAAAGTWPLQGTTGREFMAFVSELFINPQGCLLFHAFYHRPYGSFQTTEEMLQKRKEHFLTRCMAGDLENLLVLFRNSFPGEEEARHQVGDVILKRALGCFVVECPDYRFFSERLPLQPSEASETRGILKRIALHYAELGEAALLLERVLLPEGMPAEAPSIQRATRFYQRCMQMASALTMKAGADKSAYTRKLAGRFREAGDVLFRPGFARDTFHSQMGLRQHYMPLAISATHVGDADRGEDALARLNVLTDIPEEWLKRVEQWRRLNSGYAEELEAPDPDDEYFIYETLIGCFPLDVAGEEAFLDRFRCYLHEFLREGNGLPDGPAPDYEDQVHNFLVHIFSEGSAFREDFLDFHRKISFFGLQNSIAQLVLKYTCPGVPELDPGREFWDFGLKAGDGRADLDLGRRYLHRVISLESAGQKVLPLSDPACKLWAVRKLLRLRNDYRELFLDGEYKALETQGRFSEYVVAFMREAADTVIVVVVPVHTAVIAWESEASGKAFDWEDTYVVLPGHTEASWKDMLTENLITARGTVPVSALLRHFQAAVLEGYREAGRDAGLLLHASSLPSPYGIGDIGPEAYKFADFLHAGGQRLWQFLPVNPTDPGQSHSPYSALSSSAGNMMMISPDLLVQDGWLDKADLDPYVKHSGGRVDYEAAGSAKTALCRTAYERFLKNSGQEAAFEAFCGRHRRWLHDFSMFMVLREKQHFTPWWEWPAAYRDRDPGSLEAFHHKHLEALRFVKWMQFVFDSQWQALKACCRPYRIRLLGDLPFYVGHNSCDVWAQRALFALKPDGNVEASAGVPPDAFSSTGQAWGMPVYNWEAMKEDGYRWWIDRLRRNLELFDMIRLDHFRAFADYWVVPGGAETAMEGTWKEGPGAEFFYEVKKAIGGLPFIAEDLGEISEEVRYLRKELGLPGMKVLQFAFGEGMSSSEFIPHHYGNDFIAYTGTHDNNTTRGWYRCELDKAGRKRVRKYLGRKLSERNVTRQMIKLIYGSVASSVVIPVQDLLNLDERARMNTPGSCDSRYWTWRLRPGSLKRKHSAQLRRWTALYDR